MKGFSIIPAEGDDITMDDNLIIELYNIRDENAIIASDEKYGKYCFSIANNILGNNEDSQECTNDTWFTAWKLIPPEIPKVLRAFFGKITRNNAINMYHKNNTKKRGGGQFILVYDELRECISDKNIIDEGIIEEELVSYINKFLEKLPKKERIMFVNRYYSMEPIKNIAKRMNLKENHVRSDLSRTRVKLKKYLTEVYYSEWK